MNKRIRELALESGFSMTNYVGLWEAKDQEIERFVELIRAYDHKMLMEKCDNLNGHCYLKHDEIRSKGATWRR